MKKPSVHLCNVLESRAEGRRLWQFDAAGGKFEVTADQSTALDTPLPDQLVAKDWHTLFQKKLNVAWLPAGQVFLRVVQLPAADPAETAQMVEFQLEKLSPMPVAQIVWSIEFLPGGAAETQTVIVVLAARSVVEEFLGTLEGEGYLPDRLELPQLHQLLSTRSGEDGVWLFPDDEAGLCLAAWWWGEVLQNLHLLRLPAAGNRAALLTEHLTEMAWAGELEGWLVPPVRAHLVADSATTNVWEPIAREWTGEPVQTSPPLSKLDLAGLTARRAARGESNLNLLPAEHAARHRQQFVDRLWMRGLGAALLAYGCGVLIYLATLEVVKIQARRADKQVTNLSGSYTNALQLKARIDVLQDQLNLKFAALETLKVASDLLPGELTLNWLNFQRGRTVTIHGTAPLDQTVRIADYNQALRQATNTAGRAVFTNVNPPAQSNRPVPGGQITAWNFDSELNRSEME